MLRQKLRTMNCKTDDESTLKTNFMKMLQFSSSGFLRFLP